MKVNTIQCYNGKKNPNISPNISFKSDTKGQVPVPVTNPEELQFKQALKKPKTSASFIENIINWVKDFCYLDEKTHSSDQFNLNEALAQRALMY